MVLLGVEGLEGRCVTRKRTRQAACFSRRTRVPRAESAPFPARHCPAQGDARLGRLAQLQLYWQHCFRRIGCCLRRDVTLVSAYPLEGGPVGALLPEVLVPGVEVAVEVHQGHRSELVADRLRCGMEHRKQPRGRKQSRRALNIRYLGARRGDEQALSEIATARKTT